MEAGRLGVALVGLGEYSTEQLGPALTKTKHCYLAGVVSGSPDKQEEWKERYDLKRENIFDYSNFDSIALRPDIDVVYIVLPNALHARYAIRAAEAGKHVIVEKPMAVSPAECREIINACNLAGVKLGIGYRLHYDHLNREVMMLGQNEVFGRVEQVIANNSKELKDRRHWRLQHDLSGGGPLVNNGIYCIQAAIYVTGHLPVRVMAKFDEISDPSVFNTVEEGITWEMEMENGATALCKSSYTRDESFLRVEAAAGWFELDPAYEYRDLKGRTSAGPMLIKGGNQQPAQMDDFALSVMRNTAPRLPGEMGLRDVQIIDAIYRSAHTKAPVTIEWMAGMQMERVWEILNLKREDEVRFRI